MLTKLRQSLPLQLLLAALLAWFFALFISPTTDVTQTTWYQLVMLGKVTYIGLLKMVVGLVVMLSLLQGITSIGSITRLKKVGRNTLLFYSFTTLLAISLGLGASLLLPAWQPLTEFAPVGDNVQLISEESAGGAAIAGKLLNMAFVNPVAALTNGNLLAIVVFSFMLGLALLSSLPEKHPIFEVLSGLNKSINTIVGWIIKLSPLAVFAIVFDFTIRGGESLFEQLALFALLVFVLTLIHGAIVLPTIAKVATGIKYTTLFKAISAPMAMAFATSSSSATLPLAMQSAQDKLGVSQSTSSMVLPLGAVMNMDGTALFEGVAAIFLAQLFGVDLTTSGLIMIFIMAMVSSVGAPGMPSGSMSGMQLVLLAAGIPLEAIAILLIIERPLDTFRTAVNVEGDMIAALVIDKWQKKQNQSSEKQLLSQAPYSA
ncbi:dicarboxylate/amino acid:cation symporter [Aliivibrio sp. S4TY2]|uniref:dicarboxylate/amino acid:cation symporter n=1 Tax=unclassified Aliivibrio TaxID=2645654 RepID=UPI002378BC40|nr:MULTISPECIES: dicarboxylate/amino acid:cation symporter [unclassified Aliivibrio]MDD9157156.1 dicarboxylate/amino acid:cation symporter [Aliivibrio sp. S4TY2]MDD9161011.1 dicarboxylate/amino acid:cation symporter [Aliivibrio sp. S4TY1]MDD9165068.1 dicarboxylate/amino acid:cation symporter [Aliivibrio sp. S4MY2]MDD9169039.1 dicarboxylate/amino acid:cation symporter [Aliivibrio sp. S4MY4]MDD9185767.1 dicarboxylate/amino acid:cation symporter [Aliivibrio sp. S4MY3]